MLVQCPSCQTTYRVPEELISGPNPSFRCSRCKHVFTLAAEPESKPEPESPPPTASPVKKTETEGEKEASGGSPPQTEQESKESRRDASQQETLFDFGSRREPPSSGESDQSEFPGPPVGKPSPPEEESDDSIPYERPPSDAVKETTPEWSRAAVEPRPEETPSARGVESSSEITAAREAISEFEEDWERSFSSADEDEGAAPEPEEQPASTVPYLTLFAVLLLLYSVATLVHQIRPSTLEGVLKRIPWFGTAVFQNNHLRQRVILESLSPSFQTIVGNREVFVLSGVAHNRNPVGVREVQIEGQIYDRQGTEVGRQSIWVGNAITPKIIKDLTAQEISILQKLSPQKRFEIPPQKGASFVIVFFKPRAEVKDFTCRVVGAEGAA